MESQCVASPRPAVLVLGLILLGPHGQAVRRDTGSADAGEQRIEARRKFIRQSSRRCAQQRLRQLPSDIAIGQPAVDLPRAGRGRQSGRVRRDRAVARQPGYRVERRAVGQHQVQALPGDQLRPASLERRLPNSHIDELDVELVADSEGALR